MDEPAEALIPIDLTLRFVLFGLECALGVALSAPEAERVFREAAEDQVSAKDYVFHQSRGLSITGRVDKYEPETIWLRVDGRRNLTALLERVIEAAEHRVARLRTEGATQMAASPDEPAPTEDLAPEYDFRSLRGLVRGKYAERYRERLRVVRLADDVAGAFADEAEVNAALREYLGRRETAGPD